MNRMKNQFGKTVTLSSSAKWVLIHILTIWSTASSATISRAIFFLAMASRDFRLQRCPIFLKRTNLGCGQYPRSRFRSGGLNRHGIADAFRPGERLPGCGRVSTMARRSGSGASDLSGFRPVGSVSPACQEQAAAKGCPFAAAFIEPLTGSAFFRSSFRSGAKTISPARSVRRRP